MLDLFGRPDRWGQTLRNLLWTHTSVVVPAFQGPATVVDMHVPCTFDFNVASTKYFEGVAEGAIPLLMLFSGTVFYAIAGKSAAGRAHSVGSGSAMRASGEPVARNDVPLLPQLGLAQPASRCVLRLCTGTRSKTEFPRGNRRSNVCWQAKPKPRYGAIVNFERVEEIAEAVLYEGYMLYPYRPSSVKNRQRFNFGVLCPPAYCEMHPGSESSFMHTECLFKATPSTRLTVKVRFLQLIERSIARRNRPSSRSSGFGRPSLSSRSP